MYTSLLNNSKGPELEGIQANSICNVLKQQAFNRPLSPAVVDLEGTLTYKELDELSDGWAKELMDNGLMPGDIAAVILPRDRWYLVLIFAIMKAGAAFLPLDKDFPPSRVEYMLKSSGAKLLLANSTDFKAPHISVPNLIRIDKHCLKVHSFTLPEISERQNAYVIYTSGTTGTPKGVSVSHKALMALLSWYGPVMLHAVSSDQFCAVNNFCFDASIADLFPPIVAGASVHILPESIKLELNLLRQYIIQNDLTLGTFTTRFGIELLDGYPLPLRTAVLGGEKLSKNPRTKTEIINGYGPTEFTVCSHYYRVLKPMTEIPIGKPAPNTFSYVLDDKLNLMQNGEIGDLYLSGKQIANGYLHDEETTSKRFIPNPYSTSDDTRLMYHTGDLVRWNQNGELEYIGRKDMLVKVRGYRIDLTEIENAIDSFPNIENSAAVVRQVGKHPHICAYYQQAQKINQAELRDFLAGRLPHYFLPDYMLPVPVIPLTKNGKLDIEALPLPKFSFQGGKPATENEQLLLELAVKETDEPQLGIDDDLIEFMDSISVMHFIVSASESSLRVKVSDIYRYRTIRLVAKHLDSSSLCQWHNREKGKPVVVLITGATPVNMIHTFEETFQSHFAILTFNALTEQYDSAKKGFTFPDWIKLYQESLLNQLEDNDELYAFAGHCFGGELAYALADLYSEKYRKYPSVWIFNSQYYRKKEKTDYSWNLSSIQKLLFDNWLSAAHIINPLIETEKLPSYTGKVLFFQAGIFTANLLLPDLPPVTTDAEELLHLKQLENKNIQDWQKMVPDLSCYKLEANHWTVLSSDILLKILKSNIL